MTQSRILKITWSKVCIKNLLTLVFDCVKSQLCDIGVELLESGKAKKLPFKLSHCKVISVEVVFTIVILASISCPDDS